MLLVSFLPLLLLLVRDELSDARKKEKENSSPLIRYPTISFLGPFAVTATRSETQHFGFPQLGSSPTGRLTGFPVLRHFWRQHGQPLSRSFERSSLNFRFGRLQKDNLNGWNVCHY